MTRLDKYSNYLTRQKKLNVFIKRDDLFDITGGGNKGRKLKYILNDNVIKNHNAIVTTGSNQSNHIRASLIRANELGWKTHIVIHDVEPKTPTGNLKLTKLLTDKITYVQMGKVAETMDNAMTDFIEQGLNPLYIWGGGHCLEGSLAYYDAVLELKKQFNSLEPDYIFLASGTGATQAGLIVGAKNFFKNTKVVGISIAREKKRGTEEVLKSVNELENHLSLNPSKLEDIAFEDKYNGGGYGKTYKELDTTIEEQAQKGIILDSTYTAKSFYGMLDYIKTDKIMSNSTIVFWHTGGLLNFLS